MSSSRSNKGGNGSGGSFPIEIVAKDIGIDQQITKLTKFTDVIKILGDQFRTQMSSMNAYNTAFSNFGKNFNTLNTGFNQGAAGAQKFNQAMQQNVNVMRQGQTTLNQFMNTQKQTAQTTQQAATAEANLTANTQRMNQAFAQTSATLGRAQGQMMTLNRNAQQTANTMRNATSQTKMYDEAIFENNNAMNSNNMATENHTKSTKGNTDAIIQNMRHISALGLGFMMLTNTMTDSGLVQENIKMQEDRLAEAHIRTAEALKEHGKASTQYQQAAMSESKITRGLAFEKREATAQTHNMMFMEAMIASEILSSAVPALLHYKETIAQVSGAFTKLKSVMTATNMEKAFTGLSNALSAIPGKLRTTIRGAEEMGGAMANAEIYTARTTKQMGALSTVQPAVATGFRGIMAAALPIAAVLAAVAAVLLAIQTDFMGVRTSLENFGYSLSEQIPVLYPLLEGLQGIGAQLGLTGESAEEAKQHFDNASTGFEHMGELWDQTVSSMQNSSNRMVKAMGDTAAVLGRDITQAAGKLDTQLKATANTWNQFVDALGRGDYKTATDLIISSFEAIPGIIFESLRTLGQIVLDVFDGLKKTVGPAIVGVGTELGKRLMDGLKTAWATLTTWVQTNLISPIQEAINGIADGIKNIANLVWNALGFPQLIIWSTTIASNVGKAIMGIVDFVGDIATSVWDKLGLAGLFDAAYQLGKDVWDQITQGINDVAGAATGAIKSVTGDVDKTVTDNANNTKTGSAFLDNAYGLNKGGTSTTQTDLDLSKYDPSKTTLPLEKQGPPKPTPLSNQNPPGNVAPVNVMQPNKTDYSKFQQAFGASTKAPPTPTPVTPQNQSPYALDQTAVAKKAIDIANTAAGSGASKGTHEFIKGLQEEAKTLPQVTTAAEKQKAALDKLAAAHKDTGGEIDKAYASGIKYLQAQQGIAPALLNNQNALSNVAVALTPVIDKNNELSASIAQTSDGLASGYLQTVKFTQGQLEQRDAMLQDIAAIDETNGKLTEYGSQIQSGVAYQVAFIKGQQDIVKQFDDTIVQTGNLNGQFSALQLALNNAGAAQIEYNNGMAKGMVDTAQAIINIDAMRGSYDGTRKVLIDTATSMGILNNATMLSNDSLMNLVQVAKNAPDAIKNLTHWILELGNSMMTNLVSAVHEGSKEFNKAIDDIEENIGFKLGKEIKTTLKVEANIEDAVNTVKQGLGVMSMLIKAHADPSQLKEVGTDILKNFEDQFEKDGDNVGNGIIDNLKKNFQGREGEISAIFTELKTNITTIMNSPIGSEAFNNAFANLQTIFATLNGDIDNLGQGFSNLSGTMQQPISSAGQLGNALQGVSDNTKLNLDFTNNYGQAIDVFNGHVQTATQSTNDWSQAQDVFRGKLDSSKQSAAGLGTALDGVNTSIANASTNTNNYSQFQDVFSGKVAQSATSTQNLAAGLEGTGTAAATADPQVKKLNDTLVALGGVGSVIQQTFEVNFPVAVSTGVTTAEGYLVGFQGFFGDILGQLINTATSSFSAIQVSFGTTMGQMINTSSASFTAMSEHPKLFSEAVDAEFGKAADDGISLMEALDSGVSQSFDNMSGYPSVVSEAVDKEFGKAADDGKNLIKALESAVKSSCDAMASAFGKVSSAIDKIKSSADSAKSSVNSLKSAVTSLPNVDRTITYHIETVGSKPTGGQFGLNMQVDKPHFFLAGEGLGKERVKIQPGTQPFVEDFRREMAQKFAAQSAAQSAPTTTTTTTNQQQQGNPNIYSSNYSNSTNTNQQNNPDLGNGSTGVMISNNASLIQMNNSNGKKMIVDGKTGTVMMLNESSSSSSTNTNTNTNNSGSGSGNVNEGTGNTYTDANGNNYNYDNDSNSKSNVYAPGYGQQNNTSSTPNTGTNTGSPNSGSGNGITQTQTNSQSGSGQNYYYQSQTNNGQTTVNSNIPMHPGMINQSSSSSGTTPVSGSYSSDSRSRLLSRGDPFGFQHRIISETPVEVNVNVEGIKLARALMKIINEQLGWGSGYYG